MRLLVTRSEPDAKSQADALAALGHEPVLSPLLEIEFLKPPLALYRAQALIATSRNALRAAQRLPQFDAMRELPLMVVGEATAETAQTIGFDQITEGPGTAAGLAEMIAETLDPGRGELIHLAGENLAFNLQAALESQGFEMAVSVLYRAHPAKALSPEATKLLDTGALDGVILMSPRTAQIFADLTEAKTELLRGLYGFCLSVAVARPIEQSGMTLRIAHLPRSEELLALIAAETSSS